MCSLKVHKINFFEPRPEAIQSLAFDETTAQLAVSRADSSIAIWNLMNKPCFQKVIPGKCSNSVEAVVWSQGRLFSAGLHGHIIEHDLDALIPKRTVAITTNGSVWCLGVNKQNSLIVAGTEDGRLCFYNISCNHFDFDKVSNKQEGRILCLDWHESGDFVVTGSVDSIRVWDVRTGQIVDRIVVGRSEKNVETIVWCIAVTKDMTIISGDSRGKTSFWNGKMGTMIECFASHTADVLSLCLNKEEDMVYTSGVDPLIIKFNRTQIANHANDQVKDIWMKTVQQSLHSHDVRSLLLAGEYLVSGGVDTNLVFSKYPPKTVHSYSPFSQMSYISASLDRLVLLKYPSQLELWKLGSTLAKSGQNGEHLPIDESLVKMLLLKSKGDEPIICSTISKQGNWIAYSSMYKLKLFFLNMEGCSDKLTVQKSRNLPEEVTPGICLSSTTSGHLVILSSSGQIQILNCKPVDSEIIATIKSELDSIHIIEVSPNDAYLAVATLKGKITVYDLHTYQVHCHLPSYQYQVTALKFDSDCKNLVATYSDRKFVEYDVEKLAYSKWSRQQIHETFQNCSHHAIKSITFAPNNNDLIIFQDEDSLYVFDKSGNSQPGKKRSKGTDTLSIEKDDTSNFKRIEKYKHLLNFCFLQNDEIVALEVTPSDILNVLPPPLMKKKYGT